MKLRTKYMVCFVDEHCLSRGGTDGFVWTVTFETSSTFDTKLEAIEYLKEIADREYNYTILEIIEPYK